VRSDESLALAGKTTQRPTSHVRDPAPPLTERGFADVFTAQSAGMGWAQDIFSGGCRGIKFNGM
jgi:hypothetical protein